MYRVSLPPPPSPADHAAYREWQAAYVGQLCPSLPDADRAHFVPRGLHLCPRRKTPARIRRVLIAAGWRWSRTALAWSNVGAFLPVP
jgi:hypothetical protein